MANGDKKMKGAGREDDDEHSYKTDRAMKGSYAPQREKEGESGPSRVIQGTERNSSTGIAVIIKKESRRSRAFFFPVLFPSLLYTFTHVLGCVGECASVRVASLSISISLSLSARGSSLYSSLTSLHLIKAFSHASPAPTDGSAPYDAVTACTST